MDESSGPTKETNDKSVSSLASELLKYGSGTFGKRMHDQYVSMYLKHGPDAALAALGHKLDSQPKLLPKVQKELGISSIQTLREKMSSMPEMQFPVNAYKKRKFKEKTNSVTGAENTSEIAESAKTPDAVPVERPEVEKQEDTRLVTSELQQTTTRQPSLQVKDVQSREMFQAPEAEMIDVPKTKEDFVKVDKRDDSVVFNSYKPKKRAVHRYFRESKEESTGPYSKEQYKYIKRRDPGYLS
jgi:hypothetical protein